MIFRYIILIATGTLFAADLSLQPVSELALFNRCYAHITQLALSYDHPLRASVENGQMSAVDACMQVLDSAKLVASGGSEGQLINDSAEARAVLLSMNDFHRLWFPNDNMNSSMPDETFEENGYLHDEQEAALHITRALFTDGVPYSSVINGDSAMEGLRSNGSSQKDAEAPSMQKFKMLSNSNYFDQNRDVIDMNPPLVQTGELLGVRRMTLNPQKQSFYVHNTGGVTIGNENFNFNRTVPVNESMGAGIIGTRSYLLLNIGRPDFLPSNGGVRMNRRWSKAVFSDILCRELPVLRQTDAAPFVNKNPGPDTPPFRASSTCMSCHATMDPMAATIRNVSFMSSYYGNFGGSMEIAAWPATQGAENGPVDDDILFFQRPTNGKLFYRSYDGTLIDRSVASVPALGNAISETNDFYVCAAARYFQYFTGIAPNLQDLGDPASPPITSADEKYRDIVIQLGMNLKANQSLRSLVRSIISSDLYRRSAMREAE